ncbi:MAG: helix-turn-helix transcriptional regulator [Phycisphaerae bacterium]|nr:helix-turn-helix transcriptional regulator [Phycisphaerae bacterium]
MSNDLKDLKAMMLMLGEPFALAFAVFIRELAHAGFGDLAAALPAHEMSEGTDERFEELAPADRQRAEAGLAAAQALKQTGQLEELELPAYTPETVAGNRLRRVLAKKKMKQVDLAKKMGISPAVVNRVLKNPDRSMVATLRKIAAALDVELYEIID